MAKGKVKHNGRNKNGLKRYIKIEHELFFSDAYQSLSPNAVSLLVILISRYKGDNNGHIWLSEEAAAGLMGVSSRATAHNAFVELQKAGLIKMAKDSYFNQKSGDARARCWLLTWEFNHCDRKPATHDYKNYSADNEKSLKRVERAQQEIKRFRKELSQN